MKTKDSFLVQLAINLIEGGRIPTALIRGGIRKLLRQRLSSLKSDYAKQSSTDRMWNFCRESPIASLPEKANEQHYEIPAEFYLKVLGPCLKYSCCFFEEGDSLAQAEINALNLTCENAQLKDGMQILELGCGWGSLTMTMAERYPNSSIVAVSNSESQRKFIESRAATAGFSDRVEIITADMNDFQIGRQFDRVVSVEMFEHMRNYERLLENVAGWLKPGGKLFIHIFCHKQYAYPFETEGAANWMGRYFFSGGIMPSIDLLNRFDRDMRISRTWNWDGTHYEKTCRAWAERMKSRKQQVMPVLIQVYGDDAKRWWHRWLLFFEAGAELFGFNHGSEWQVAHLLFDQVDQNNEPESTESRNCVSTQTV